MKKDENVHRFALSALKEKFWREKERKKESDRESDKERQKT